MKIWGKLIKYFSPTHRKLVALAAVIITFNFGILALVNINFQMPWHAIIAIGCLPYICFCFFFFVVFPQKSSVEKLAACKYMPYFPYYFYHHESKKCDRIDVERIEREVQTGDIILRRYKHYLDEIIFSQNSYFTHVGICYKDKDAGDCKVFHATGSKGVHTSPLDEFCNCLDVAVLRFSLEETEEERAIHDYVKKDDRGTTAQDNLKKQETDFFEKITVSTKFSKLTSTETEAFYEECRNIIIKRAQSLIGTPYDFKFNFKSFETFSCIEFVWYCFKSLFPFHHIRIRDFEFFKWIVVPIITPDVFIKNDFFQYKYTSLPGITDKHDLKKVIKKRHNHFMRLVLSVYIWNVVVLTGVYLILKFKR